MRIKILFSLVFLTFACVLASLCLDSARASGDDLPDLVIDSVGRDELLTDHQLLLLSGHLDVTISNIGAAAASAGFKIIAYEDNNFDGKYTAGVDTLLGSSLVE